MKKLASVLVDRPMKRMETSFEEKLEEDENLREEIEARLRLLDADLQNRLRSKGGVPNSHNNNT